MPQTPYKVFLVFKFQFDLMHACVVVRCMGTQSNQCYGYFAIHRYLGCACVCVFFFRALHTYQPLWLILWQQLETLIHSAHFVIVDKALQCENRHTERIIWRESRILKTIAKLHQIPVKPILILLFPIGSFFPYQFNANKSIRRFIDSRLINIVCVYSHSIIGFIFVLLSFI